MAERHDERRHAGPIVPDPAASLTAHRLRHPPPPRLWPLWLLLLVLLGALGGAAYLAWEERERLNREVERLQGELSNVHARFDAALGEGESLEAVEARLVALERRDEAHDGLLAVLGEDLETGLGERDERLAALQERVARIGEAAATREAMLAATQLSLDALERSGAEGRAALASAIESVEASVDGQEEVYRRHAERFDALEARLADLTEESVTNDALEALAAEQEALAQRLEGVEVQGAERIARLEERLAALGGELEALAEARDDETQEDDALAARFAALEGEIGELRRTQLAVSARLEALRP
ncbi:hypothetical protein [uncultured Halomonas sp.]|mgnify:CR=1 FL=1|uniref:hypothetical protein n=1 Tax=uncultured Halomonas sp. TaxID=173971 RepID=UPI002606366A|nr:hypothetical protein [uncultured Halomonas sp.]